MKEQGRKIGVINAYYNRYYCTCGVRGEWKSYYDKNKFYCESCKAYLWTFTRAKNVTNISRRYDIAPTVSQLGATKIKIEYPNTQIIFINNGEDIEIKEVKDVLYYDIEKAKFTTEKGRQVSERRLYPYIYKDVNVELRKISDIQVENPFNMRSCDTLTSCINNRNLLVLEDFGILYFLDDTNVKQHINVNGTNLENILGIPKSIVKYVLEKQDEHNIEAYKYNAIMQIKNTYETLTAVRGKKEKISVDDWLKIAVITQKIMALDHTIINNINRDNLRHGYKSYYALSTHAKLVTMLYANKYNLKSLEDYISRVYDYQGLTPIRALETLKDYSSMNYDMGNPYEKYPKSLVMAHDLTSINYRYIASSVEQKRIEQLSIVNQWLEYTQKDYCIVIPKSADEIVREGKVLHHCVASYVRRVADGETIIAFLRKIKDKDTPLGTIELQNNVIVQKRRFGNSFISGEELKFVRQWAQAKGLKMC